MFKKKEKSLCIYLLICIFLISFVSSQPSFLQTGSFTEGYDIKIPAIGFIEQSKDLNLNFHLFNISNGYPISNSSVNCYFHLYNSIGDHVVQSVPFNNQSEVMNEWEISINGQNFSVIGDYSYLIQCNSSTLGGYESVELKVTPTGRSPPSQGEALIILGILASIFFMSVLFFALSFKVDGALKFGFIACSFVMALILILYINSILSETINGFPAISGGYEIFYYVLLTILLIIFLFILVSLTASAVNAWRTKKGKNPMYEE